MQKRLSPILSGKLAAATDKTCVLRFEVTTTQYQLQNALAYVWLIFGIYWFLSGIRTKAAKTRELSAWRFLRLFILAATFSLLFGKWTRIGFLGWRFVPVKPFIFETGLVLALAGISLALWARLHLGKNWSDKVILKVDHELIRSGPYAYFRHPIYSGVLLGILGTGLVVGEWRCVLAFCILLANYSIKAKREDHILAAQFGDAFQEHKRQAGFLLPRFH
jgi:protein-S-isoprenylcysteine O-methyltransferase Ste14